LRNRTCLQTSHGIESYGQRTDRPRYASPKPDMFKFDFQIDDIDDETNIFSASTPQPQEDKPTFGENSFDEHLLQDLVRPFTLFKTFPD
jgi:hypothetical protein